MSLAQYFEWVARRNPNRPAVIYQGHNCSYGELERLANRFAAGLERWGVVRGDRVAILLNNCVEFIVAYLGAQKIGGIAVSVNALLKPQEVSFILVDCGPRVLVTDAAHVASLSEEALPFPERVIVCEGPAGAHASYNAFLQQGRERYDAIDAAPEDPASIVYSSATTGFPKGVTLSQANLEFNSRSKVRYCGIRSSDRLLLFVPLSHCFGQNAIMNAAFHAGATIVMHHSFDREALLHSLSADQVTMFFAVPTIYILLLRTNPAPLKTVRYFFSAADTLPTDVAASWQERFSLPIYEGYGLTETSPFASYNHERLHRLGSIGSPIERVSMHVADPETGAEVPIGEAGEILISGPNVMLGYWNRPEETAAAIRDGWLHTGDLGRVDADGYFYIVDRLKDMIRIGGLKVFPAEVEKTLYQHEAVAEAAAFGIPDPVLGERVGAKVVLKPGVDVSVDALRSHCGQRIADHKIPVEIEFVKSLPKTASGKVLRRELRPATARTN